MIGIDATTAAASSSAGHDRYGTIVNTSVSGLPLRTSSTSNRLASRRP
jgi:hypothetical protein